MGETPSELPREWKVVIGEGAGELFDAAEGLRRNALSTDS